MNADIIIAIVPAKGHEGLTAEGPEGEMPATVQHGTCLACYAVRWVRWLRDPGCACGNALTEIDASRAALVLHAPGGPRLGMVRARAVCQGDPTREEIGQFMDALPVGEMSMDALGIWCFAHLMRVRGFAAEVLVLPVDEEKS